MENRVIVNLLRNKRKAISGCAEIPEKLIVRERVKLVREEIVIALLLLLLLLWFVEIVRFSDNDIGAEGLLFQFRVGFKNSK